MSWKGASARGVESGSHAPQRTRTPASAQKRRLYNQLTWWFGGYYGGKLDQVIWTGAWNPTALLTVEFTCERDSGRLPAPTGAPHFSPTRQKAGLKRRERAARRR